MYSKHIDAADDENSGGDDDEYVDFDIFNQVAQTTTASPISADNFDSVDLFSNDVFDIEAFRQLIMSYYNPAPGQDDEEYQNHIKNGIFRPELSLVNVLTFGIVKELRNILAVLTDKIGNPDKVS